MSYDYGLRPDPGPPKVELYVPWYWKWRAKLPDSITLGRYTVHVCGFWGFCWACAYGNWVGPDGTVTKARAGPGRLHFNNGRYFYTLALRPNGRVQSRGPDGMYRHEWFTKEPIRAED